MAPQLPPKTCPSCGDEFVHTALRCPDCDVELVVGPVERPAAPELPPAAELAPVSRGEPWEMQRIAEALQEAGIASRIDTYPPSGAGPARESGEVPVSLVGSLCIYVAFEDVQAAAALAQHVQLGAVLEDLGEDVSEAPADGCPACGSALPDGAASCSDCGLEFPAFALPGDDEGGSGGDA
jgi:hypothetical protein